MSNNKENRLKYLVDSFEDEIQPLYDEYKQLCEERQKTPLDFLTDTTLYTDFEYLGVSIITTLINKEIHKMVPPSERRKAKRQRINPPPKKCEKCDKDELLAITSRGNDNNYYTLPYGKEKDGYLPEFPALAQQGGDGASFEICVDCGWIQGFDSTKLKAFIQELEDQNDENDE
jgi:hypothetical protein